MLSHTIYIRTYSFRGEELEQQVSPGSLVVDAGKGYFERVFSNSIEKTIASHDSVLKRLVTRLFDKGLLDKEDLESLAEFPEILRIVKDTE